MKKIILSLLLLGMTVSCSDTVISKSDSLTGLIPYEVKRIDIIIGDTILCTYNLVTTDYLHRKTDVWVIDSIGKFKTGDTGTLNFIKTK